MLAVPAATQAGRSHRGRHRNGLRPASRRDRSRGHRDYGRPHRAVPDKAGTCALALPQRCALLVAGEDDVAARVAADEAPYPAIDWTDPGGLWASIAG